MRASSRFAFTLIELLVVIAIIAILAVVVVLTLNPAELLRQSRDSTRVSDIDTMTHAISLYQTDQAGTKGYFMGNASSVYISLPDPTISGNTTSTCAYWNLPALPTGAGYSYQCSSPQSYRSTNGSGWLPVNLSSISAGNPLGSLPADPTNQSSTGLYYTYATDGTSYEVTSLFESQKYKTQYAQAPMDPGYPEVNAKGSSLTVSPLFNPTGLVGWWPLDEGTGTVSLDQSGSGNNLTVADTVTSTPIWATSNCKMGTGCLTFAGVNHNSAYTATNATFQFANQNFTFTEWVDRTGTAGGNNIAANGSNNSGSNCATASGWLLGDSYFLWCTPAQIGTSTQGNGLSYAVTPMSTWTLVAITFNPSGNVVIYYNGVQQTSAISNGLGYQGPTAKIVLGCEDNSYNCFTGQIDDARLYNRILSIAEIKALYNAGK